MKVQSFTQIRKVIVRVLIISLFMSCSLSEKKPKAAYQIPQSFNGWTTSVEEPFDIVFKNTQDQSLAIKSRCDRTESLVLKDLRKEILMGVDRPKIISEEIFQLQDREALKTQVSGFVDGVSVEFTIVNFQKNFCQFDFISWDADQILNQIITGFKFP